MNTLLPIGTKVNHSGHGLGTIVAYNWQVTITYGIWPPRYPYIVHFTPTEQFPDGYKDVYSVDDLVTVPV